MRPIVTFPLSAILLAQIAATAQEITYRPDMMRLDGETSFVFPTQGHLSLVNGGTIEFWVAPTWQANPVFDPVIVSNRGAESIVYEIAMQADKQGVLVTSADQTGMFPFNFDDGAVHHVAFVNLNDGIVAMIDGQIIGVSALSLANLEPTTLQIGASDGGTSPFSGVIGGLRIWDAALDPETLVEYNWHDIRLESSDHPYLGFLSGYSEFDTRDFVMIDKPIVPTWLADGAEVESMESANE